MEVKSDPKTIASSQRVLVIEFTSDHNKKDLPPRYFSEIHSECLQELVACMLQVVLIYRVIDDALHITFVITNLKVEFEAVVYHALSPKVIKYVKRVIPFCFLDSYVL